MGKLVNSHNIEFGYELLSAVPFAYGLHLKGELSGTISGKLSEPLYYFSPSHKINPAERSWYNTYKAGLKDRVSGADGLPWLNIHQAEQPKKHFPPYKEVYKNDTYKWDRPTLCICNRASIEWEHSMINYFDAGILEWLFTNLKPHYEIVYFPVMIPEAIQDNQKPIDIQDIDIAKKHGVKVFSELAEGKQWNEVLLQVFANCEHYITMNGGYSILASYFAGTNIVYSKPGNVQAKELTTFELWRWYPNINNVRTLHVPSYEALKERVKVLYIDKLPTANVLIRTSGRPNYFKNCIESVLRQTYKNINIVVICDDKASLSYTRGLPVRIIEPTQPKQVAPPSKDIKYGNWFPANDYIRQAQQLVNGYIFVLDDDDIYTDPRSIEKVMAKVHHEKLVVWKVQMVNKPIPSHSFGKKPTLFDIASIGQCYHTSQLHRTDWTPWKRADYRTASGFDDIIWINEVLSRLQKEPGKGKKNDIMSYYSDQQLKEMRTVKLRFRRDFKEHKQGDVKMAGWLEAAYLLRREIAEVVEPEPPQPPEQVPNKVVEKQQRPVLKDKELKPKRKTKAKAKA